MKVSLEEHWIALETKLKGFIQSKVHDEYIAEDILHDVFIKLHSRIDTLHDQSKFQPWIYQITRNAIIDYFRKINKDARISQYRFEDEQDSPNEFMEETLQDMVKMMDELPPEYCEVLCFTELGSMSLKEYAYNAGISYSGAKSRVQRARKKLKDLLMKCCHYQFDRYGTVIDIHPVNCCCCNN